MKNMARMLFLIWVFGSVSGCGPGILGGECSNSCSPVGSAECADGRVRTCITDAGGCLDWGSPTACPFGTCLDEKSCGECIPDCSGLQCGLDPVCGKEDCGACSEPTPSCGSDGQCKQATAAEITINPDKTISINGRKTFPIAMAGMCNPGFEAVGECDLSKNSDVFKIIGIGAPLYNQNYDTYGYQSMFEKAGVFYTLFAPQIGQYPATRINSPLHLFNLQYDEPAEDTEAKVSAAYDLAKSKDPNHPVLITNWRQMRRWSKFGDIILNSIYPIRDNEPDFSRAESMYAYEHLTWHSFAESTAFDSPLMAGKPVWAVILGNGVRDLGNPVPDPGEVRAVFYTAITMGVKGISIYGYKIYGAGGQNTGLSNSPELHSYFRQLGTELISFNDILVLPTLDYSWEYRRGTAVTFSKMLAPVVLWRERTNFNFILKQDSPATYLIVVNKDSRPVLAVDVTIVGLVGATTAITLGLETSGTGRAGKILSVNKEGRFTDDFDGLAVHVYRVF